MWKEKKTNMKANKEWECKKRKKKQSTWVREKEREGKTKKGGEKSD